MQKGGAHFCMLWAISDHDGRCGAHLSLFYLTHYTGGFSCVSPLLSLQIISCPPHFHLSGWGDMINQIKSSLLEALTSTRALMESGDDLSHFLLLV